MTCCLLNDTPVEKYRVGVRWVHVKRDDLYAGQPAPPLGKLRGAMSILTELYMRGVRIVGCWDTRISALGQGIAACCRKFDGLTAIVAYPHTKASTSLPLAVARAAELGADILPVIAGRITISFAAARREVERRGGVMLPFGLECTQSVMAVATAAASIPSSYTKDGTVLVSSGSGTTLAGIVLGLRGKPRTFIGISSGRSVEAIERCLNRYGISELERIRLIAAREPYNVPVDVACPFPSHPHYDRKAWRYLCENVKTLPTPLFFWNVGA